MKTCIECRYNCLHVLAVHFDVLYELTDINVRTSDGMLVLSFGVAVI
jgi:hypothetical protein